MQFLRNLKLRKNAHPPAYKYIMNYLSGEIEKGCLYQQKVWDIGFQFVCSSHIFMVF